MFEPLLPDLAVTRIRDRRLAAARAAERRTVRAARRGRARRGWDEEPTGR
ncbi:hypothetical protein [Nocardioides sp.]